MRYLSINTRRWWRFLHQKTEDNHIFNRIHNTSWDNNWKTRGYVAMPLISGVRHTTHNNLSAYKRRSPLNRFTPPYMHASVPKSILSRNWLLETTITRSPNGIRQLIIVYVTFCSIIAYSCAERTAWVIMCPSEVCTSFVRVCVECTKGTDLVILAAL